MENAFAIEQTRVQAIELAQMIEKLNIEVLPMKRSFRVFTVSICKQWLNRNTEMHCSRGQRQKCSSTLSDVRRSNPSPALKPQGEKWPNG